MNRRRFIPALAVLFTGCALSPALPVDPGPMGGHRFSPGDALLLFGTASSTTSEAVTGVGLIETRFGYELSSETATGYMHLPPGHYVLDRFHLGGFCWSFEGEALELRSNHRYALPPLGVEVASNVEGFVRATGTSTLTATAFDERYPESAWRDRPLVTLPMARRPVRRCPSRR